MKDSYQPTYISLFCGCGGFDEGFKKSGFKCVGAYDIDPCVVDVYNSNFENPVFVHDLNDKSLPGNIPNKVDVVISGSPCQGFSTIGKRELDDPRNKLLLVGGEIAVNLNASVFIAENVLGSQSGEHKAYWVKLIDFMTASGYNTKLVTHNVSEIGLPQSRKRVILYAWKSDIEFFSTIEVENRYKLSNLLYFDPKKVYHNHDVTYIDVNSPDFIIAEAIKQGQKLCDVRRGSRSVHSWQIPEVFPKITKKEEKFLLTLLKLRRSIRRRIGGDADPVEKKILADIFNADTDLLINSLLKKNYIKVVDKKYIDLKNTFNGKFKRLDINGISPTVDTRFGHYKNFLHPTENRGFTVREAARIQGFEDTFIFKGPIDKQFKMVGNAVPPPLSYLIAQITKTSILPIIKHAKRTREENSSMVC